MSRSSRKMNKMFVFATFAMAFVAISAHAQQGPSPDNAKSQKSSQQSWTSSVRKFKIEETVKLGDVHIAKWNATAVHDPDTWSLVLGGDRVSLDKIVPRVVYAYHGRLEVMFDEAVGGNPKPPTVLHRGLIKRDLWGTASASMTWLG